MREKKNDDHPTGDVTFGANSILGKAHQINDKGLVCFVKVHRWEFQILDEQDCNYLNLAGNKTIASLCFPAVVWTIWRERNNHIFGSNSRHWESTLQSTLQQIRARASYLNFETSAPLAAA